MSGNYLRVLVFCFLSVAGRLLFESQSPPKAAGPQEIKIFPVYLHKSQTAKEIPISRPQKTVFKYNSACKSATNPLPVTAAIKLSCRIQERKEPVT